MIEVASPGPLPPALADAAADAFAALGGGRFESAEGRHVFLFSDRDRVARLVDELGVTGLAAAVRVAFEGFDRLAAGLGIHPVLRPRWGAAL